jgi:branched-chain amino acid transport system permease protein
LETLSLNRPRYKKYIKFLPLLVVPFLPLLLKNYTYGIMLLCFAQIYVIATTGLDIVYGYTGQITFATSAFFGIGAYGSVLLRKYTAIPMELTILMATLLSALIAMLFAYPVSKLRFAFLSLSTISFNYIFFYFITRSPGGITGDFNGIFVERLKLFGISFKESHHFFYFGLVCVIILVSLKMLLVRSRVGRAFLAIKQNVHAAEGMGINVRKYKVYAFGFYGAYVAFAGTLYAHFVGFISPETFAEEQSVLYLIMAMFGGLGSDWGPVIGSVSIVWLNDILGYFEKYQLLAYGILLILFIVFLPGGVVGEGKKLVAKINELIKGAKNRKEVDAGA